MDNSIKVIKQIESTHSGLGIPLLFGNICELANVSCFFIGEKGIGKGTIVKCIKPTDVVNPKFDVSMWNVTLGQLLTDLSTEPVIKEKLIFRVDEWAVLKAYQRDMYLSVVSEMISDRTFKRTIGSKSGDRMIDVEDCDVMSFVGITPLKFGNMMTENDNWEAIASDRFVKLCLINPLRCDTIESIPSYEFNPILNIHTVVPIKSQLTVMKWVLNNQVSDNRLITYCRKLIKAYCKFEGYESVTIKAESEFKQLFGTLLSFYPAFIFTQDIEYELQFSVGAFRLLGCICSHDGFKYQDLIEYFKVYEKTGKELSYKKMIYDKAKWLENHHFIDIISNSNEPHFYMSKQLSDYFEWYKSIRK